MPIYEFKSDAGDTIEEYFRVADAPDSIERTIDGKTVRYGRCYSAGVGAVVRSGGGVHHKGQTIPVSMSLPKVPAGVGETVTRFGTKVRQLADGTYCTMSGDRIVDSDDAAKKHAAACGYTIEKD